MITPQNGGANYMGSSISFAIPLAAAPNAQVVTSPTAHCPGSTSNPTAASGQLCVYQVVKSNANTPGFEDVTKYGAGIFLPTAAGASYDYLTGVWAVTG
jgi:hypothetical protein